MKQPAKKQSAQKSTKSGGFFKNIIAELRKVVWPTRREALYLTMIVLIVATSVGLILGATDLGFSELINKLFLGQ